MNVWNDKLLLKASGKLTDYRGFEGKEQGKGIVFDLETQVVLFDGFSEPHSPRRDETNGFFVCNSGMCNLVFR